jgi:serine/threonine protein kinase
MYARCRSDPNPDANVDPLADQAADAGFQKTKADTLRTEGSVSFLAHAAAGVHVYATALDSRVESVRPLRLDSEAKANAFLSLYGQWVGCGSRTAPSAVDSNSDAANAAVTALVWTAAASAGVRGHLATLGIDDSSPLLRVDGADCGAAIGFADQMWVRVFTGEQTHPHPVPRHGAANGASPTAWGAPVWVAPAAETGHPNTGSVAQGHCIASKHDDSAIGATEGPAEASGLAAWVWGLNRTEARTLLAGLHEVSRLASDEQGRIAIHVPSPRLRDDIIRLGLHAGYASHFESAKPASSATGCAVILSESSQCTEPELQGTRDVRPTTYTGRTWCVTVPHGLVWARRVERDATGTVIAASRPVLTGNCDGGDLSAQVTNIKGQLFKEDQIMHWFVQIALGIHYMHENNILHRDIKCQNIFLLGNGRLVLGDLGISKVLDGTMAFAQTQIGTPYYMSPELFRSKPYNHKSDVWALGCVLYELCTSVHPFDAASLNGLAQKIMKGTYVPINPKYSKSLRGLVASMLSVTPSSRPSLTEVLRQPYVQKHVANFIRDVADRSSVVVPSKQPQPEDMPISDGTMMFRAAAFKLAAASGGGGSTASGLGSEAMTRAAAAGLGPHAQNLQQQLAALGMQPLVSKALQEASEAMAARQGAGRGSSSGSAVSAPASIPSSQQSTASSGGSNATPPAAKVSIVAPSTKPAVPAANPDPTAAAIAARRAVRDQQAALEREELRKQAVEAALEKLRAEKELRLKQREEFKRKQERAVLKANAGGSAGSPVAKPSAGSSGSGSNPSSARRPNAAAVAGGNGVGPALVVPVGAPIPSLARPQGNVPASALSAAAAAATPGLGLLQGKIAALGNAAKAPEGRPSAPAQAHMQPSQLKSREQELRDRAAAIRKDAQLAEQERRARLLGIPEKSKASGSTGASNAKDTASASGGGGSVSSIDLAARKADQDRRRVAELEQWEKDRVSRPHARAVGSSGGSSSGCSSSSSSNNNAKRDSSVGSSSSAAPRESASAASASKDREDASAPRSARGGAGIMLSQDSTPAPRPVRSTAGGPASSPGEPVSASAVDRLSGLSVAPQGLPPRASATGTSHSGSGVVSSAAGAGSSLAPVVSAARSRSRTPTAAVGSAVISSSVPASSAPKSAPVAAAVGSRGPSPAPLGGNSSSQPDAVDPLAGVPQEDIDALLPPYYEALPPRERVMARKEAARKYNEQLTRQRLKDAAASNVAERQRAQYLNREEYRGVGAAIAGSLPLSDAVLENSVTDAKGVIASIQAQLPGARYGTPALPYVGIAQDDSQRRGLRESKLDDDDLQGGGKSDTDDELPSNSKHVGDSASSGPVKVVRVGKAHQTAPIAQSPQPAYGENTEYHSEVDEDNGYLAGELPDTDSEDSVILEAAAHDEDEYDEDVDPEDAAPVSALPIAGRPVDGPRPARRRPHISLATEEDDDDIAEEEGRLREELMRSTMRCMDLRASVDMAKIKAKQVKKPTTRRSGPSSAAPLGGPISLGASSNPSPVFGAAVGDALDAAANTVFVGGPGTSSRRSSVGTNPVPAVAGSIADDRPIRPSANPAKFGSPSGNSSQIAAGATPPPSGKPPLQGSSPAAGSVLLRPTPIVSTPPSSSHTHSASPAGRIHGVLAPSALATAASGGYMGASSFKNVSPPGTSALSSVLASAGAASVSGPASARMSPSTVTISPSNTQSNPARKSLSSGPPAGHHAGGHNGWPSGSAASNVPSHIYGTVDDDTDELEISDTFTDDENDIGDEDGNADGAINFNRHPSPSELAEDEDFDRGVRGSDAYSRRDQPAQGAGVQIAAAGASPGSTISDSDGIASDFKRLANADVQSWQLGSLSSRVEHLRRYCIASLGAGLFDEVYTALRTSMVDEEIDGDGLDLDSITKKLGPGREALIDQILSLLDMEQALL